MNMIHILRGIATGGLAVGMQIGGDVISKIVARPMWALFSKNVPLKYQRGKVYKTVVTVHEHHARKRGLHYDFRFRFKRRLISLVFPKRPPAHWSNDGTPPRKFRTTVVRTNDHKIAYESFQGEIPDGYGAGTVRIDYQSPGITWSRSNGAFHVFTPYNSNPWSGEWVFVRMPRSKGKEIYIATRTEAFRSMWLPRPSYTDVPPDQIKEMMEKKDLSGALVGEQKVDGANFIMLVNSPGLERDEAPLIKTIGNIIISKTETIIRKIKSNVWKVQSKNHPEIPPYRVGEAAPIPQQSPIDPQKIRVLREAFSDAGIELPEGRIPVTISYISRRFSKAGAPIHREGNIPHLAFSFLPPEFVNRVFRCELWHPKGVNVLSGILNSNADKAQSTQHKIGLIRAMVFDYEGIWDPSTSTFHTAPEPYTERMQFYHDFVRALNLAIHGSSTAPHPHNTRFLFSIPEYVIGNVDEIEKFYNHIIDTYDFPLGEGIVVKIPTEPGRAYQWLKLKRTQTFDLVIKDILPGTGKYSNAAGKVLAADRTGNIVATVGSGFTDEERFDMFRNPDKYIGRVIEVKAQALAKEALRAPRMIRWRDDKTIDDIDIVPLPSHEEIIKNYLRGQGVPEKDLDTAYWSVKVSTGWRPKR